LNSKSAWIKSQAPKKMHFVVLHRGPDFHLGSISGTYTTSKTHYEPFIP